MSAARRFSLLPRMAPKSKAHIGVGLVLIFLASGVTTMLILPPDVSSRNLPAIDAGDQNLPRQTERALSAFVAANDPPFLYRHGNQPVRVETVNGEHPVTRPLSTDMTVHHMARSAQWYRQYASGNRRPARPPIVVARDILASPNLPLPCLERIVRVPFLGRDGNLKTEPGYHEGDATLFVPPRGFRLPKISDNPTPGQLEVARRLILRSLLRDFPFTSEAARAHAVAALLLPLVRSFIRGPTPLHLVEKPTPGTGGTLLVQVLCQISLGETIAAMSAPKDESEWRRTVLASLRSVPLAVFIDNPQQLESPTLASAITSDIYTDRVVRTSETVRLPVSCLWIASANNPVLSREMARRVIRIRLDAGVERPELRDSFLHPQLKAWAKKNHHLLLWAALTFVQAWVAAGHPRASKVFGMFEDWVEVTGGILQVAEIPGFLENMDASGNSVSEDDNLPPFLNRWSEEFGNKPVHAAELLPLTTQLTRLRNGNEKGRLIRLGLLLAKNKDQQIGEFFVRAAGMSDGYQMWCLERSGGCDK